MKHILTILAALLLSQLAQLSAAEPESLTPLKNGQAPQTFEALWAGYDPRAESLDVETLKEWEENGAVLRVVRFRIGIFKGRKAMMAAVYGYPRGAAKLPGLVQIHGGGQYADHKAVLANARWGYATISIAWAGRISAPDYNVNPDVVKLFWDGKTDDPKYKVTTDWGALDAYHAPSRNPKNGFVTTTPAPWTLDAVDSPRNCPWFLVTLAARRALTFLEQQPEVDGSRLGVYGHSMGGKLTVLTTGADNRVKAAAPSCGGVSNRNTESTLFNTTVADDVSLKRIVCPIIFLSPSNDFHGRIDDLQKAVTEIQTQEWRVDCSPHHNHQDTAPYVVDGLLWMDQVLKGTFTFPQTPRATLTLKTARGVPSFTVTPDASSPILFVDIYYTQDGQMDGKKDDLENTVHRFWRHAAATKHADSWTAELPLASIDKPLWVYGNVRYPLDTSQTGAGYYYEEYTAENFNLSTLTSMIAPDELKANGVQATLKPSRVIETFAGDWEKEWFTYRPAEWPRSTFRLRDPQYAPPPDARLAVEVHSSAPHKMVVALDACAAEIQLTGKDEWQQVILSPGDFRNYEGASRTDWIGIKTLKFAGMEKLSGPKRQDGGSVTFGETWKGEPPRFRNLRWLEDAH